MTKVRITSKVGYTDIVEIRTAEVWGYMKWVRMMGATAEAVR
jgi:hypothetical protein